MRLLITDPLSVVVDAPDVRAVRAEDESGSFGVLPGHADFLTTLALSVVTWRDGAGVVRHCAVRRGVLSVNGGREVLIATREAHLGDDLDELEDVVLAGYRAQVDAERSANTAAARLRIQAIRRIVGLLKAGRTGGAELGP
jgi:F-type H+-transporting ATPase subunit epsilon